MCKLNSYLFDTCRDVLCVCVLQLPGAAFAKNVTWPGKRAHIMRKLSKWTAISACAPKVDLYSCTLAKRHPDWPYNVVEI